MKYILTFYAILLILREYNFSRRMLKILTYFISALAYVGAYFVSRDSFVMFEILDVLQYISLFNFVLIPFIVFAILGAKILKSEIKKTNP